MAMRTLDDLEDWERNDDLELDLKDWEKEWNKISKIREKFAKHILETCQEAACNSKPVYGYLNECDKYILNQMQYVERQTSKLKNIFEKRLTADFEESIEDFDELTDIFGPQLPYLRDKDYKEGEKEMWYKKLQDIEKKESEKSKDEQASWYRQSQKLVERAKREKDKMPIWAQKHMEALEAERKKEEKDGN